MQLILSGNPNLEVIWKVVYLANKYYNQKISHILFIDNIDESKNEAGETIHSGSLFDSEGNCIEGERNSVIRNYIENISIESKIINKKGLHHEIPKILSKKLNIYGRSEIIVDLTNGDKYISSTLYASASLSQIENLFFLVVSRDKFKASPEKLGPDDYKIDVMSPLRDLEAIGKYAFFEILYYKDKVDELFLMFEGVNFKSGFLRNQLCSQLEESINSFFLEYYSDSITKIGQIIEEISLELPARIKQMASGDIKEKCPKNFDESITWLRIQFCDPLRGKRNKGLKHYQEQLRDLQTIDKLVDLVRVYRNFSSHPYDFLRDRDEARLVLKTSIYILDKVGKSGVFHE